jgi:hypothetical protein
MSQNLEAQHKNLNRHKWQNRVLVVKTDDLNNENFIKQLNEFYKDKSGLIERKLVLYKFTDQVFYYNDFETEIEIKYDLENFVYRKGLFRDKNCFEVILIGLDGHVKIRQNRIITLTQLFETIDVMPMRKNEIRGKDN